MKRYPWYLKYSEKNLTLFIKSRLSKHPYQCSHFTDDGTKFQKSWIRWASLSQCLSQELIQVVCLWVQYCQSVPRLLFSHGVVSGSRRGSSVHGISQARILKCVAISFSRGIFLTQGLYLRLLPWQAGSLLLCHQGSCDASWPPI